MVPWAMFRTALGKVKIVMIDNLLRQEMTLLRRFHQKRRVMVLCMSVVCFVVTSCSLNGLIVLGVVVRFVFVAK